MKTKNQHGHWVPIFDGCKEERFQAIKHTRVHGTDDVLVRVNEDSCHRGIVNCCDLQSVDVRGWTCLSTIE